MYNLDKVFIKKIVYYMISKRIKLILISFISILLGRLFVGYYYADQNFQNYTFFIVIFLFLLSFLPFSRHSILPSANVYHNSNLDSQSGNFSWKYLHSIVEDRRSFLVSVLIVELFSSINIVLIIILVMVYLQQSALVITLSCILVVLVTLKGFISNIKNLIEFPRKHYFKYGTSNVSNFLLRFSFIVLKVTLFLSHLAFYVLTVKFFGEFKILYGLIVSVPLLLFYIIINFKNVLRSWEDERLSFKKHSDYLKEIAVIAPFVLLFSFLNMKYHGHIYQNSEVLFNQIEQGNLKKIKDYSFKGDDINKIEENGFNLIHKAITENQFDIVEYFIKKGSSLELKVQRRRKNRNYQKGMSPLMLSVDYNRNKLYKLLVGSGAKSNVTNEHNMSLFHLAVFRCNPFVMTDLYRRGVDINAQSKDGESAYHFAVKGSCLVAIKYLKSIGVKEDLRNLDNQSYLEFAKDKRDIFFQQILLNEKLN